MGLRLTLMSGTRLPVFTLKFALMLALTGGLTVATAGAEPIAAAASASAYRLGIGSAPFRLAAPDIPSALAREDAKISGRLRNKPYATLIHNAALNAALEPALVHAVIAVESAYNPAARSPKGAIGLMQLMPDTALRYGVKDPARSPQDNLRAGTLYLKDLMQQFNHRLELVLAAYNAGENAVLRHGERIPPYPETQRYVPAVLARYRELREAPQAQPASTPAVPRFEYLAGTRLDPRPIEVAAE